MVLIRGASVNGFVRTCDDGVLLIFSTRMLDRRSGLAWALRHWGKRSLLRVSVHLRGIQPRFRLGADLFSRTFAPSEC